MNMSCRYDVIVLKDLLEEGGKMLLFDTTDDIDEAMQSYTDASNLMKNDRDVMNIFVYDKEKEETVEGWH